MYNNKVFYIYEDQKKAPVGKRSSRQNSSNFETQNKQVYKPYYSISNIQCKSRLKKNLIIEQQHFSKQRIKYMPYQTFFEFNKIIRGKLEGDLIKFTLIPVIQECEIDYHYLIQRFNSFGDQKFKALADAIARIQSLKKRIPEIRDEFFNLQHVMKKIDIKRPLIIFNDRPVQSNNLQNAHKEVYVSQSLMNKNGFNNPQQFILECVRRGDLCFPFLINLNDGSLYIDRITSKVLSMADTIEGAMQIKASRESQSQSSFRSEPEDLMSVKRLECKQSHQKHNSHIKYEFVQTPFLYCSQVIESIISPVPEFQLINRKNGLIQEQEYDLLQRLVPISQNKLKRFEDKVCTFRELGKVGTYLNQ